MDPKFSERNFGACPGLGEVLSTPFHALEHFRKLMHHVADSWRHGLMVAGLQIIIDLLPLLRRNGNSSLDTGAQGNDHQSFDRDREAWALHMNHM